jgi:ankyrin repeat protein
MRARRVFACFVFAVVSGLASSAVIAFAAAGDIRLVTAAKNRDFSTVQSLIKQRLDVNAPDIDGMTPLHWAAHWDEFEIVKQLLAAGANAKAANRYGVTALHEAALIANVPMMAVLLKSGANADVTYGSGETPLMIAARTGNVDAVKLLVDHGANVNGAEEFRGQTPLMFAVTENHPNVVRFLIDQGAQVNARSAKFNFGDVKMAGGGAFMDRAEGGLSPLFFAAREGAMEAAQVLIAAGADLNVSETQYGFTPLMTAIFNGHYDFAGMLIEKSADVNDGSLYLIVEIRNLSFYKNRPNPPDRDKNLRSIDVLKMLLDRGADPNKVYTKKIPPREAQGDIKVLAGATPLYRATKSTDLSAIRLLMAKGADPSIALLDQTTPLMVAAGMGTPLVATEDALTGGDKGDPLDAIKLFVKAGADVNAANNQGFTAMHYAAQTGRNSIVEFLAANGAKLDLKNKADKTPLDLAMVPGPTGRYMEIDGIPQTATAALIRKLMAKGD